MYALVMKTFCAGYLDHLDNNAFAYRMFSVWPPREWNSICILSSAAQGTLQYVLNGDTVFHSDQYNGVLGANADNLVLMNDGQYRPMHGSMIDVNVWSTLLTAEQLRQDYLLLSSKNHI